MIWDVAIIGGGAAGFFTAINTAEKNPDLKIVILEKSSNFLSKVKVSGGGRCNFTHACFDPKELAQFYPRGNKELLGPFNRFASGDTIEWFESRGVSHYTVDDGSIFPTSDDSQSVIDLFLNQANKFGVKMLKNIEVSSFQKQDDLWVVKSNQADLQCKSLVVTTGSNKKIWSLLSDLGHNIIKPVPSLFTFKIKDARLDGLMGQVIEKAEVWIENQNIPSQRGPLLITHWGMSGPSVLKLSAFAARYIEENSYQFKFKVNFLPDHDVESIYDELILIKSELSKQKIHNYKLFPIANKLFEKILSFIEIDKDKRWADASKKDLINLANQLCNAEFFVNGKSKFKEEFVTAGGVDLKEIDFKTYQSKLLPNLYFAGETMNIDAVTGGFNFQNAWTGGWIISEALAEGK
jgi:predicted Rossmann fold flavoprotein